jgi:lactoylglutathione lyase
MKIKYLHTMVRVKDIEESKRFYCDLLGLEEIRRVDNEAGKFTLVFLAPSGQHEVSVELTHNWDSDEDYTGGRNFGHLAYEVENIYEMCQKLMDAGVTINRPPRDGRMAFVRSPDGISIELLNAGGHRPLEEPWASMSNTGTW